MGEVEQVGNITAVCISPIPVAWPILEIPFFCYTKVSKGPFLRERIRERIEYLVQLRNEATAEALKYFPKTEHILSVESYYVDQADQISRLLSIYDGKSILGASTWLWDKTRILPTARFYDTWATPGTEKLSFHLFPPKGKQRVRSVGSCIIFPRYVWEQHGYGVPEPFPDAGCEYNYLCERSGLPVWLSLDVRLWRDPKTIHRPVEYPWLKRIRCSLHLGRFLRR